MSALVYILGVLVIAIIAKLLYPSRPSLTPNLKKWLKKGEFLAYNAFDIFYIDEKGNNPKGGTLIAIHGFPTSSYDWIKILDGLKSKFNRVLLLDMLGYGLSDKPTNHTYSIMEQADIAEALLKKLEVSEVHILSHDYGDTVALELLARYNQHGGTDPEKLKLKSLCLTNGGVFPETNFPKLMQKILANQYIGPLLSRLSFYRAYKRGFSSVFGPRTQPTEEDFQDFYAFKLYKAGPKVTSSILRYLEERQIYKERWVGALQHSKIPVHMIYGPLDPINSNTFPEYYKKVVPNPSITVLSSHIGHYPQWEAPDDLMKSYAEFVNTIK